MNARRRPAYLAKRLSIALLMLFAVTVISFLPMRLVSIDRMMETISISGELGTDENKEELFRHGLGQDQPIHIHYLRWMGLMPKEDGSFSGVLQFWK